MPVVSVPTLVTTEEYLIEKDKLNEVYHIRLHAFDFHYRLMRVKSMSKYMSTIEQVHTRLQFPSYALVVSIYKIEKRGENITSFFINNLV